MKLPAKALKWKDNVYGHHWICTAGPRRATWYTSSKQAVWNSQGTSGHVNTGETFEDPLTQITHALHKPRGAITHSPFCLPPQDLRHYTNKRSTCRPRRPPGRSQAIKRCFIYTQCTFHLLRSCQRTAHLTPFTLPDWGEGTENEKYSGNWANK